MNETTDGDTTAQQTTSNNRIFFHGNPWKDTGHAIEELNWSGRLVPERGIFFDLHLVTAVYDADDEEGEDANSEEDEEEDDEDVDPWERKSFWENYQQCTMSSTEWGDQHGFLAGTTNQKLDFVAADDTTMSFKGIDPLPSAPPYERRAFHIYLLGHDGVADHEIVFRRNKDSNKGSGKDDSDGPATSTYTLEWNGKIAREYVEDDEFRYSFSAQYNTLQFQGIQVPPEITTEVEAIEMARKYCKTPLVAVKDKQSGTIRLVPDFPSQSSGAENKVSEDDGATRKRKSDEA